MGSLEATDSAAAAVATKPRVSLDSMKAKIKGRYDFNALDAIGSVCGISVKPDGSSTHNDLSVLSICVLVMENGFTVIGKSAPASPENFNADLGKNFAFDDAIRQLWPLEGYALREKLTAA